MTVAPMSRRRTASGRRSSWVKTTTWRSRPRRLEDAGETVHAGRVHGLDGVVDDDEAERAFGEGRPRDEEAEGQGVELALAHDAQGGAFLAVDG
jgi:hypothetical protein